MHSSGTVRHLPSLLTAATPAEYAAQELLHSLCSEPGIIQTGSVTTIQLVPTAILRCRKEFALSHVAQKIRLGMVGIQITVHLHGKFETKSNDSHPQYITAFSTKYTHFSFNIYPFILDTIILKSKNIHSKRFAYLKCAFDITKNVCIKFAIPLFEKGRDNFT